MPRAVPIPLGTSEMIAERPFTHTDYILKDRDILVYIGKRLRTVLEMQRDELERSSGTIFIEEPDGRYHRHFVSRPNVLSQAENIYLVGFFSHKQKGAFIDHFGDLDDRLIEEIPAYEEILSYSTMALPDGNYGNLVLLMDEEVKTKWLRGETHNRAVSLSPDYYQFVRINNGVLPEGVARPDLLQITQVKYYDYGEDPPWKAVRKLSQG